MPMMKTLQTRRLASTTGHVVLFKSNVPTFVHKDAVREAAAMGAVVCDDSGAVMDVDDKTVKKVEFVGSIRSSLIYLLFQRFVKDNKPGNFDSGGIPKNDIVARCLGFEVAKKEVKDLWQKFQTAMNSGDDLPIDPKAQMVLDIIDANDNSDLQLLASELHIAAEDTAGLTTRDLRALLLTKFDGLTNVVK